MGTLAPAAGTLPCPPDPHHSLALCSLSAPWQSSHKLGTNISWGVENTKTAIRGTEQVFNGARSTAKMCPGPEVQIGPQRWDNYLLTK